MQRFIPILLLFLLCDSSSLAQAPCPDFHRDSVIINCSSLEKENLELIDLSIKNNGVLQFIRKDKTSYLRIVVQDNLGYGQTGEFMLICGKKQIYDKDVKLISPDGKSGYFVLELNANYILTLKELGLNKIIFKNNALIVPKADSEKIKQTAACFSNAVMRKN